MKPPNRGQTLRLSDGRELGWCEQGSPTGSPVIFLPGAPDSRLAVHPDPKIAEDADVRLVSVDRPGYGLSTPSPGRTVAAVADDIHDLAASLGFDRFVVVGWSAGAPHALACAAFLGPAVTGVVLVAPAMPIPGIDEAMIRTEVARAAADPVAYVRAALSVWPEPDVAVLDEPGIRDMWLQQVEEALRCGGTGFVDDLVAVFILDWGFQLTDIACPVVVLHGEADTVFAAHLVKEWAGQMATCFTILPDVGHRFLFSRKHWARILDEACQLSDRVEAPATRAPGSATTTR